VCASRFADPRRHILRVAQHAAWDPRPMGPSAGHRAGRAEPRRSVAARASACGRSGRRAVVDFSLIGEAAQPATRGRPCASAGNAVRQHVPATCDAVSSVSRRTAALARSSAGVPRGA
jgi:hypothetical protein